MFNHREIEKKWQAYWAEHGTFKTLNLAKKADSKKFYALDMFPYPSGSGLHVGHPKGYTATDIIARYKHARGFHVLHPMGWDAFGLPAENYAIKTGTHPAVTTAQNVTRFRTQLQKFGFSFDWGREVNTTDPEYFRWTQWIFLKLFEAGLAYESDKPINFCPSCKTGLANEEVVDGKCERCGTSVEKKAIRQWILAITKYADRLLADIDRLDWPEGIKEMQRNWIGRKTGINIAYQVEGADKIVECFTTRPDTNFGATFVVLGPEHALALEITKKENKTQVKNYIESSKKKSETDRIAEGREKTGVFTGAYCINNLNNYRMPIWIADYVLGNVGTGAVVGVPGHDIRDFEFAVTFDIPIKRVVVAKDGDTSPITKIEQVQEHEGTMINSDFLNGLDIHEATTKIMDHIAGHGWGKKVINYKLRDWIFSRQRYWGEPIPIIHISDADFDSIISLNFRRPEIMERILSGEKTLETRVLNPDEKNRYFGDVKIGDCLVFNDTNSDNRYLVKVTKTHQWKNLSEFAKDKENFQKTCGEKVSNTLKDVTKLWNDLRPGYADEANINGLVGFEFSILGKLTRGISDWLLADWDLPLELPKVEKYEPSGDGHSPLATILSWVEVKLGKNLIGHRETNTMPQWAGSCWYYLRFMDPKNDQALVDPEIVKYWGEVDSYIGGAEHAVLHLLYARFWHKFLYDIGVVPTDEPFFRLRNVGLILGPDGNKMSKSKGNVINPDDVIAEYGADTLRLYEMSMADFSDTAPWNTKAIIGSYRLLERIYRLYTVEETSAEYTSFRAKDDLRAMKTMHKTIKKVGEDIDILKFNTAISAINIMVNEGIPVDPDMAHEWKSVLARLLHPFAPHTAEECFALFKRKNNKEKIINNSDSIFDEPWPEYIPTMTIDDEVNIAIQINGKLRGTYTFSRGVTAEEVRLTVESKPEIAKWIQGMTVIKEIFIPDKIFNIVVK